MIEGETLSGGIACNIFQHSGDRETIELDLQESRNDKLKNLGI
jgi:hypothetical protein